MTLRLQCVDKGHEGETWQVDLHQDEFILKNSDEEVVADYSGAEAPKHLVLPRLLGSRQLAVHTDDGDYHFQVTDDQVTRLNDFVVYSIAHHGVEEVQALRRRGLAFTTGGVIAAGLAVFAIATGSLLPFGVAAVLFAGGAVATGIGSGSLSRWMEIRRAAPHHHY